MTTGTGFVRQQGPPSPQVFKYTGTILTQAQFDAMKDYFDACATRTPAWNSSIVWSVMRASMVSRIS